MQKLTLLILLSLSLFACSSNEEKNSTKVDSKSEMEQMNHATNADMELAVISPSGEDIGMSKGYAQAIYMNYMQMKDYLVQSDGRLVQAAAEYMDEDLRGAEGELAKEIIASVKAIKATQDIEVQRAEFQKITARFMKIVKAVQVTPEPLYVIHCPMAFGNTGADWLSESQEVQNPYFGDAMMTCGTVTSVVK